MHIKLQRDNTAKQSGTEHAVRFMLLNLIGLQNEVNQKSDMLLEVPRITINAKGKTRTIYINMPIEHSSTHLHVKINRKRENSESRKIFMTSISLMGHSPSQYCILGSVPFLHRRASYRCISCKLGETQKKYYHRKKKTHLF